MWPSPMYDTTKLTVELGELVESGFKLWGFDYPSYYKGEDKEAFEQKVLDHYRFRQIGLETPGRFAHQFRTKVREIMPYYIQLYESVDLMAAQGDPFEAYNLTETYKEERANSGSSSGSTTANRSTTGELNGTERKLNTPGSRIENLDDGYLTEAGKTNTANTETVEGTDTATSSSEDTGTTSYTMTRRGNIGVQPLGAEVEALRKAFINVDMMIINELNELFLGVY